MNEDERVTISWEDNCINTDSYGTYVSTSESFSVMAHSNLDFTPIDTEASMCNMDEDYFMRVLFADLREIIHIDINYDRTEFKKLKIYMMETIRKLFKSFIDRGIIEEFNIVNICSEGDYILVIFNILRNNKLHILNHRYFFESKNYGLK